MAPIPTEDDDEYQRDATMKPRNKRNEALVGMLFVNDDDDGSKPQFGSQRIAQKRGTASTTETTASASNSIQQQYNSPKRNTQMQQDVISKQQGRASSDLARVLYASRSAEAPRTPSQRPCISTDNHKYAEQPNGSVSDPKPKMDEKIRKEEEGFSESYPSGRGRLEDAVQAKIRRSTSSTDSRNLMAIHRTSTSRQGISTDELDRLDERIAARNSKVRLASTSKVTMRSQRLQTRADLNEETTKTSPSTTNASEGKSVNDSTMKREVKLAVSIHPQVKTDLYKEDTLQTTGMQQGLCSDGDIAGNGLTPNHADLEYGVYDGSNEKGLVVAFAVDEDGEDMFIPSAVQFDPDAKPPIYRNRRFRLYACLAIIVVVVGTVAATVGISLTPSTEEAPQVDVPYRATLGIRESVERIVGSEKLEDLNSPYRKALDWIQDSDPFQSTPESATFTQRYIAAYFYFATSVKKPWGGGCSPAKDGESDECVYKRLTSVDPVIYAEVPWWRWLSINSECVWAGIFCDESGQVRSMEFSGSNLTGSFPEGIVGFPFLQSIALTYSELEGTLPDVIADMKHLVNIELQGNLFNGTIPTAWYQSRSLQRINLAINQISGSISSDISAMRDLKGIFLYENLMTGTLPSEIGLLRSLSYIRINRNFFVGSIPTTFGNLKQTYDLWLQRNMLTGPIPSEIALMRDLSDFRVQSNMLTGKIPEEIYDMPAIGRLDLFDNKLNGTISTSIGKLSRLDQLRINDNQLTGVLPTEMGLMTTLASFVASGNNFDGVVPEQLCNLRLRDVGSYFIELQTDCFVPRNGIAEIVCPQGCCTHCCYSNGTICIPTK